MHHFYSPAARRARCMSGRKASALLAARSAHRKPGSTRKRPSRPRAGRRLRWPGRLWRHFRRAPALAKAITAATVALMLSLGINWIYQVIRKPSELFFPVSGTLYKTPPETWRQYAPIFEKYATSVITSDFLAAVAQVEGSGNPVARTYWRWVWTARPFEVYRPASSAVGMYQITDGNFAEARRYCVKNHIVAEDGPWNSRQSCWFNSLYARVVPAHAVELTSAYLDRTVAIILERHRVTFATLKHKQAAAALIHLCGAGAGDAYVRRGFRLIEGQRCGDHGVRAYLAHVDAMQKEFGRLDRPIARGHELARL
jgi:hypothetical protein